MSGWDGQAIEDLLPVRGTIAGITRTTEPMWRSTPLPTLTYQGVPLVWDAHAPTNRVYIQTQPGYVVWRTSDEFIDWRQPPGYSKEDWSCLQVAEGL